MPTCGWCPAHLRCLALGSPVMSGGGIWDVGGRLGAWLDFSPHTADPLCSSICGQPGRLPKTCWRWPATTQSNRAPSPPSRRGAHSCTHRALPSRLSPAHRLGLIQTAPASWKPLLVSNSIRQNPAALHDLPSPPPPPPGVSLIISQNSSCFLRAPPGL